jgi:hypothetical protein
VRHPSSRSKQILFSGSRPTRKEIKNITEEAATGVEDVQSTNCCKALLIHITETDGTGNT